MENIIAKGEIACLSKYKNKVMYAVHNDDDYLNGSYGKTWHNGPEFSLQDTIFT